ncbi:reduction of Rh1 [Calliopsis andreniformis]|uniref:reduction of Rh1 n=1 Tax=Calliopsis andreniformis TaxID=337506 RepID=UPI003FCC5253
MAENPEIPQRPMKYPYTLSAKIAQFPFRMYYDYKGSWMFKWWIFGTIATLPIFYKIQRMSYSPENVKKWREMDRQTFLGHSHH